MNVLITVYLLIASSFLPTFGQYTPDWDSLDSRPLPQWYDDAKIGIFLHWGVFSVPSYLTAWFWFYWQSNENTSYVEYMEENYRPGFTYQDFGPHFTAEFFDPNEWANLFEAAGARYVVLTSKHHEGFTLWPSKYSWNWNAMDLGPNRDLLGDLANAIRNQTNLRFGLYHSLYEWYNPLYLEDQDNNLTTNNFVAWKTMPELYELTNIYKPEIIWSDGDWEAPDWYWNSTNYLAWLFNESPVKDTVVVNDRWGENIMCHHGSFYTCADRYNPGVLQSHKWENAMTLDRYSWGYDRTSTSEEYLTIKELLSIMLSTISCGVYEGTKLHLSTNHSSLRHQAPSPRPITALDFIKLCHSTDHSSQRNLLVNTGPTHDGRIEPIMEERLRQMGEWLSVNGEAIYASKPWIYQNDSVTPDVWYTRSNSSVYATFLTWPKSEQVLLGSVTVDLFVGNVTVNLIGYGPELQYELLPSLEMIVLLPSLSQIDTDWAWVLKIQGIQISYNDLN